MDEHSERYFPNHRIERDIGLAEYNLAAEKLKSEDQALNWSTNTSIIIFSIASLGSFRLSDYSKGIADAGLNEPSAKIIVLLSILFFSIISIFHITNLIRSRVFSERKIIALRRMLGVTYGQNSLVLPNWRVEGADNPFAIHIFPGYFSFRSSPVWIISLASSFSIFFLLPHSWVESIVSFDTRFTSAVLALLWFCVSIFLYRSALNEANENWRLWLARVFAKFLGVRLVGNFENTIYQVRLSIAEAHRIHSDFSSIKTISVQIEDNQFYEHKGINWRGVARATLGKIKRRRAGGGSSITQQFARSNFIVRLENTPQRKIVEMLLAKWIHCVLTKSEVLEGYLTTARFAPRIYGFHLAYRHFFHDSPSKIEPWEAFFLIERLGNIRDRFIGNRIEALIRKLLEASALTTSDAIQTLHFYQGLVDSGELTVQGKSPDDVKVSLSLV